MKFKGDIIITDPCYIIKNDEHDDWGKCGYGDNMEALGIKTYLTRSTEYGDWSCTTLKDIPEANEAVQELNENYAKLWNNQGRDKDLEKSLLKQREELVEKYDLILGNFCADAGLVSVFLLSEVLEYNPDFDYHKERKWTTTLIENFDGDVEITHRNDEVSVVGRGNVNFYTTQTGL